MIKAKDPRGPWSPMVLVKEGKGLIDACPLWDEDGRAYIVHAFAGSRAGMKSVLAVFEMSPDGTKAISESRLVFDGHPFHTTVEGAKFYKHNGYYYIFAPAGGVKPGWQLAMRSKNVYGPYEEKIVLANPVNWINDWPVMGVDKDGDGCGEPVNVYEKPAVGKTYPIATPVESDEFDGQTLGLQWQWQANSNPLWYFPAGNKGYLRLFAWQLSGEAKNLWDAPALLLQKFPAPDFKATTKLTFQPYKKGERAGLVVMGQDYAAVTIDSVDNGLSFNFVSVKNALSGKPETVHASIPVKERTVYFRVEVKQTSALNKEKIQQPKANCTFSYSLDGKKFTIIGDNFAAWEGKWIGAKVGIFCQRPQWLNDSGYADFDWFRVEK
ncbi:MAG: Glycosyl hydrolases family 43 [Bacteroidetes bacterium ADurb.Bin408]|nr:MAG: Glycosyl hydrolases family 43 [Bacteroidetes bacterium ADurb.Bin408]